MALRGWAEAEQRHTVLIIHICYHYYLSYYYFRVLSVFLFLFPFYAVSQQTRPGFSLWPVSERVSHIKQGLFWLRISAWVDIVWWGRMPRKVSSFLPESRDVTSVRSQTGRGTETIFVFPSSLEFIGFRQASLAPIQVPRAIAAKVNTEETCIIAIVWGVTTNLKTALWLENTEREDGQTLEKGRTAGQEGQRRQGPCWRTLHVAGTDLKGKIFYPGRWSFSFLFLLSYTSKNGKCLASMIGVWLLAPLHSASSFVWIVTRWSAYWISGPGAIRPRCQNGASPPLLFSSCFQPLIWPWGLDLQENTFTDAWPRKPMEPKLGEGGGISLEVISHSKGHSKGHSRGFRVSSEPFQKSKKQLRILWKAK